MSCRRPRHAGRCSGRSPNRAPRSPSRSPRAPDAAKRPSAPAASAARRSADLAMQHQQTVPATCRACGRHRLSRPCSIVMPEQTSILEARGVHPVPPMQMPTQHMLCGTTAGVSGGYLLRRRKERQGDGRRLRRRHVQGVQGEAQARGDDAHGDHPNHSVGACLRASSDPVAMSSESPTPGS